MFLKDLFDGFIVSCQANNAKKSTIEGHKICLRKFISPVLGDKKLEDLRLIDVDSIQSYSMQYGKSRPKATVITFRRLLIYAKKCGHTLPFNIEEIEIPRYRVQKPVQALSIEDIYKIRQHLTNPAPEFSKHVPARLKREYIHATARFRCLFEFMLHTGLRLSEALSVNIDDIDFEKSEIRIKNVKTEKWEMVYIYGATHYIREYLELRKDTCPALFVSAQGKRLGYDTAQTSLKRIKKKLNLKGKNLTHHIERKTFITLLLKQGGDPKKTQKAARHASLQTTLNHYYALDDDEVKAYVENIMGRI